MSGRSRGTDTGRRRFLGAMGSAAVTGMAGCVGTLEGATPEEVTLRYVDVSGDRTREMFDPVVDQLNERHDSTIELAFESMPYANMKQKLLTQVGGGNGPDIAAIDQIWLGSFIDSGTLLDLSGLIDAIDFEDYLDPFASPVRWEGGLYGIPITTDVRGMYWNRRQFESAGLDPDRPPRTWDELVEMGGQLHDPPETFATAYFVVGGRWTVNLFAAGGSVLDEGGTEPRFQEPPGVEAAGFIDRLYNEAKLTGENPLYQDGARVAREFLQGTYAISVVEGSWLDYFWKNLGHDANSMVERFGFAPTPHPEDGSPMTMSGGFVWAGFESTDHPDIVRDFLRIAGERSFKRELAIATQAIPTRESLLDDDGVWDGILYADTVKSMLRNTRTRPVRNWATVAEHLDPALQRVAFDRAEPGPALEAAAEKVRNGLEAEA